MIHDEPTQGDIVFGDPSRLEDMLGRDSLTKVTKSFFALFGLSVRVISDEGERLADAHPNQPLCRYLNTVPEGAARCTATVAAVCDLEPTDDPAIHPCFTGAVYCVVPLEYHGRAVGRFIVGPYVPADSKEPPATLVSMEGELDPHALQEHFSKMPRVREDIAHQISDHLRAVIEALMFSGHRAQLASTMQVASVRESYRQLTEKNEALKESFEDLRELDRLKSTFLATVSHELRTPLTSIIGYTEMLESGAAGEMSAEQTEFLQTIRSKADELLALIGSLLDLGRLEAKTLELNREPVDVRALLAAIASTIVPAANRRNVTIEIDVAEGTPRVWGDPIRLRQILLNLVDNSLKFTSDGGNVLLRAEPVELTIGGPSGLGDALFATPRPAVVLSVRDTGIGIEEAELERIFDAFYQVDAGTTRTQGGAGLGLSIVKQLVDGHEGTIEVTSKVAEGTLVTVTLPAANDDA